uniref:F-box associated beta-propeller type 3 domain-containing protein n=1 Tax=Arundo donax TaxID=35708 RepID=A0A0A9ALV9_ARUDO
MSHSNCLYLCNPTTRHWVSVFPPALQHDTVAGLYVHGPSSEYRVLYYRDIGLGPITFYITTVGSGKERCIWPHSSSASVRKLLAGGSEDTNFKEPFLFHGNLYWLLHLPNPSDILVFDTLHEVFRWLRAPVIVRSLVSSLLEIDGKLALSYSHLGASTVDLWLLQDCEQVVWVHKHRIELPVMEISRFEEEEECWYSHILSREGDVLVDGFDWQLHYDIRGNLLEKFQCNGRLLNVTAKILRESLLPRALFQAPGNTSTPGPPFFWGL